MSYRSSPSFAVGGISYDPETKSFAAPPFGWRCFHCNEHFTTRRSARRHFGERPEQPALCVTDPDRAGLASCGERAGDVFMPTSVAGAQDSETVR